MAYFSEISWRMYFIQFLTIYSKNGKKHDILNSVVEGVNLYNISQT